MWGERSAFNTQFWWVTMCITWTDNLLLPGGLGRCIIHESQDVASVRQHDLWILLIPISICHQWDPSVIEDVVKHMYAFRELPVKSRYKHYASKYNHSLYVHIMWIAINGHSFIILFDAQNFVVNLRLWIKVQTDEYFYKLYS